MKPLFLELEAFGTYPSHQVLDFTPLLDGRLFVIHGQTGAGKTTLFDAICYALYGEASAQGRDKDSLRSHHAEQGIEPFVNFRFAVGQEEYEIRRTLPFWKGKNKNETKSKVVLKHLASERIWEKDADEQVMTLLGGMKAEQFRQVIILPQGEFQKFLKSKTDERREILKVLFQTQVYSHVEELLKQQVAVMKSEYDEQKKNVERLFAEALPSQKPDEYTLATLDEELVRLQAEEQRIVEQMPERETAWKQAAEQARLAEERQKSAASVGEARQAMMRHSEQIQAMETQKARLQKAREADRLEPQYKALQQAEAQQRSRLDNRTKLQRKADEAANAMKAAQDLKKQADASAPRINELTDEIARWNAIRPSVVRLEEVKSEANKAQKMRSEVEQSWNGIKSALQKNEEQLQKLQDSIPVLTAKASQKQALQAESERWNSIERAQTTLREEREKFKTIKSYAAEVLGKEQEAALVRNAAYEAFVAIERDWRKGQAIRLSLLLQDNEPCPVCGSLSHPQKAHQSNDSAVVSDADYDTAQSRKESAEKAHQILRDEVVRLNSELDAVKKQGETLKKSYEADFGADFTLSPEECSQKKNDVQQKIVEATKAEASLQAAEKDLQILAADKNKYAEQLEREEESLRKAMNDEASKLSAMETILSALPKGVVSLKELDARLEDIQKEQKEIQAAIEKAEKDVRDAETAQTQAQATLEALSEEIRVADGTIEQERRIFLQTLTENGFSSIEAFSKAVLSQQDQAALQKSIDEWTQKDIELAAQFKERILQFGGEEEYGIYTRSDEKPHLAALLEESVQAEQAWKELVGIKERLSLTLERLRGKLSDIRSGLQELEKIEKDLLPAQMLAKTANGDNPFKMRFQDFVLAALLDEIIASANLRLRTISSGRYALERKNESDDKRRAEMLDFDIIDFHTGTKRNARTLSGGETFFTSLALALGLADVVAMRSGGIRMDALFIDEGFGSLDAETLDIALDTLTSLQAGGRLVGVISHVSELKERIPTRLEIIKTAQGSKIGAWQGV